MTYSKITRSAAILALLISYLALTACSSNIGVGLSVGIPVGNHGYISLGSNVWR